MRCLMAPTRCCCLQTNVMSVDATPALAYIVGGCMDDCVHIWHLVQHGNEGARAAGPPADGDGGAKGTELVEYACGGYQVMHESAPRARAGEATAAAAAAAAACAAQPRAPPAAAAATAAQKPTHTVAARARAAHGKVTRVCFDAGHAALASTGGTQSTVWTTFSGDGPAGSMPVLALGHTKAVSHQVGNGRSCMQCGHDESACSSKEEIQMRVTSWPELV